MFNNPSDFNISSFWDWTEFSDYIHCLVTMVTMVTCLTYTFLDWPAYIETIGTLSLCIEATLAVPQFVRNYQTQSTEGMR